MSDKKVADLVAKARESCVSCVCNFGGGTHLCVPCKCANELERLAAENERLREIEQRAKRALVVGAKCGHDGFYAGVCAAADFVMNNADDDGEFTVAVSQS